MKKLFKRLLAGVLILVGVAFVVLIVVNPIGPGPHLQTRGYQTLSMSQMKQLALAVALYQGDHKGNGPEQLADIYPDYMPVVGIFLLETPYSTSVKPPENLMSAREAIMAFSPYVYMPLGKGRFVIFERPGLWRGRKDVGYVEMGDRRLDGTSNYHIVSFDQFEHLIAGGFPEVSGSTR